MIHITWLIPSAPTENSAIRPQSAHPQPARSGAGPPKAHCAPEAASTATAAPLSVTAVRP